MKKCLNCNIEVGGNQDTCPLCQNSLTGEPTRLNWPSPNKLKAQALLYKLQLFVILAAMVVGLSLDFLLGINNGRHYSLIIAMWLIVFELDLARNIKRLFVITRMVNILVGHICVMLLITGWYFDFYDLIAFMIVPILLGALLIFNLIFSMIDTTGNALVYLLTNILVVVIIYGFMKAQHIDNGLTWDICLMESLVALIGIIIFKGRKVSNEVRKRINF